MFRNYLKVAFRVLLRKKSYSIINIAGLSISLAVTFLMLLWVQDEWNTDKFHANGDRIFRIKRTIPLEGQRLDVFNGISYPMMEAAVKEIPEVEKYMPIGFSFEENLQRGAQTLRANGTFANTAYFEAFSYPVLIGDITQLDKKINALAISESLAKRFFGNVWESTALGEMIHIFDNGDFIVEAVYADFPENSSIKNDFYFPLQNHLKQNDWLLEWGNRGMQGVLLLSENADPKIVGGKLQKIFRANIEGERKEGCFLQKYADHYLYGQFDEKAQVSGGRVEYVRIFMIAAILLLIISCINFVNLATAYASKRAKEVGVKKVIGAGQQSLIGQFMVEAGSITFVSVVVAMVLTQVLLPQVNLMTNKTLVFDMFQPAIWTGVLAIFLITTLLSGAYPSFVLSSFRPINVLKGKSREQQGTISFRKMLVVLQFGMSLLLIVGAMVVQKQVHFIKNKNLGIDKENLLTIHQDEKITEHYEVLRNELINSEGIADVTVAGPSPFDMQASTTGVSWPGKRPDQENIEFQLLWSANNFPDVFNLEMAAGEFYRGDAGYDSTHLVLNEKAIEIMGIEDPIGKSIQLWDQPWQIIGVLQDFHNRSLYEEIEPAFFFLEADNAGWLFVKSEAGQVSEAISSVEAAFKKVIPEVPLHYDFVDERFQRLYESEELTGTLANYFALISIFISCLGLFGLATFTAEQRTKEIGIRKVLGATTAGLVGLLSKDFLKLVFIAFVIASPLAYYFMKNWLMAFAYHIDISWLMFALAGALAAVIAFLTVGFQSVKAALANPVESLRSE
ncbi:MAG: ABC transporter permease [Bacteroidota bacterium]